MSEAPEEKNPAQPFLSVLKGNPDEAQVAALTALFASMAANAQAAQPQRNTNMWGNLAEKVGTLQSYNPASFRNVSFY